MNQKINIPGPIWQTVEHALADIVNRREAE